MPFHNPGPGPLISHPHLQAMSDAELSDAIDSCLEHPNDIGWSMGQLMAELNRRSTETQTRTMVRLTWAIAAMTLVSTVFVALSALNVIG